MINPSELNNDFPQNTKTVVSIFKQRHQSLNDAIRKRENERIQRDNLKILLQMVALRPTTSLQRKKLEKEYEDIKNIKQNIIQ
jgi:hypothetical protein